MFQDKSEPNDAKTLLWEEGENMMSETKLKSRHG